MQIQNNLSFCLNEEVISRASDSPLSKLAPLRRCTKRLDSEF